MARTQVPTQPTGVHWGEYASASELPGTAGGAAVEPHLTRGDIAVVDSQLYTCISPAPRAAVWSKILTGEPPYLGAYATGSLPTGANVQVGNTAFDTTLGQLVVCTAVGPVV